MSGRNEHHIDMLTSYLDFSHKSILPVCIVKLKRPVAMQVVRLDGADEPFK